MLIPSLRRKIDWVLGKLQIFLAVTLVAFGAALKVDLEMFKAVPWLVSALAWMQSFAWLVVVFGPIMVGLIQLCRRRWGNPWALDAVQKLLDEFREDIFKGLECEPTDSHRVTLFKYQGLCPHFASPRRWRDWLVAVARSGHLTKRRIRRFRAPDDGESCEGVVGRAWRCCDWVIVPDGDPLVPPTKSSPSTDIKRFADATWVDPDWVRQQVRANRPLAASYAALLVLMKGRPWGVLVIDSQGSNTIDADKLDKWKVYGRLLTPLLERI